MSTPDPLMLNLSAIAAFIGGRLNHPRPPCNGGRFTPVSTIYVEQYKVKFDHLRIYCELANLDLIQAAWTKWGKEGASDEEYKAQRLLADAVHYRKCYREMVALVPHGEELICDQADYAALLYPTLDQAYAWIEKLQAPGRDREWMDAFLRKYKQADVEAFKAFFKTVYERDDSRFG